MFQIDPDFAQRVVENTRRYIKIFSEAVDEILPNYKDREVRAAYFCVDLFPGQDFQRLQYLTYVFMCIETNRFNFYVRLSYKKSRRTLII